MDFLSIATVMLTLAGLSLGKDIPLLKKDRMEDHPGGVGGHHGFVPAVHRYCGVRTWVLALS